MICVNVGAAIVLCLVILCVCVSFCCILGVCGVCLHRPAVICERQPRADEDPPQYTMFLQPSLPLNGLP